MATLTGRTISASYTELLKTTGSGGITSSLDTVQDGDATDSALQLSSAGIKSTGTLEVAGVSTLTGSVTLGEDAVITFEGATDDAFETTLTTVDPTADRTVSLPNATDTLVGKATTDTLTNKTLTSPALDTGVSGTAVLDSDTMSGASATTLATSESIKAYVDAQADTDTTYTGGTNLTLDGTTFNVDDAFLKNDASDTTTGTITAGGFTTTGTLTLDSVGLSTVQTSAESFADNDTSVMTSAAVADKVEAYGYSTLALGTSSSTALAGDTTTISSGQASAITANTSKTTNATHTGEVTGSAALTIANDVVDEANLKVDNAPTDDYVLTAKASATGGLTWAASGSSGEANQNAWSTITVPAGTTSQAADTTTDSVAFTAAGGMTITGGADDTIEFSSADTNTNQLTTFTVSATTDTTATTISQGDDLFFAAGTGITCETTADGTVTIANTVTDTNTTYTAGDGLDLSGTEFSTDLKANGGVVIESTELAVDLGASSITGTLAAGDGGTGLTSTSTLLNSNTTKSDVGLGSVENTALSTWAGTTNVTTLGTVSSGTWNGTDIAVADGGTGASTASTARTNLGLAIGSDVQAYDAELTTLAGLTEARGSLIVGNHLPEWSALAIGNARQILTSGNFDVTWTNHPVEIGVACSDETSALTDSTTAKVTFRMPHAMTLTEVRASLTTDASGSGFTVDVHESGTTVMATTKVTIDDGEGTSTTASPAVISDSALADDAKIEVFIDDLDASSAARGLKVWLIGYR